MRFPPDASPRFGAFTLRTECPTCGAHLPVNGPVAEVDCADCAARVKVPGRLLADLADQFEERWPNAKASDTVTTGDLTWRWTSEAVAAPACGTCAAPIGSDDTPEVPCGACGATTSSAPAPDVLRDSAPSAKRVYGADADGTRTVLAVAPVAMSCPQCGAGLSITTSQQRMTPCGHCGVTVHLPDAVWRQLHPPRAVRAWTVRFDGESRPAERAMVELRKREAAERKAAEKERARKHQQEAEAAERARKAAVVEAARAEQDRRKEEKERRFQRTSIPLVVLAWLTTPAALVGLVAATAWYVLGTPTILIGRVSPAILAPAARIVVVLAALAALAAWVVAFAAVARRSRQSVRRLFPLGLMHLGTASAPVVGWMFSLWWAYAYVSGREPSWETDPKPNWKTGPLSGRLPLAALVVAAGAYTHLVAAALLGVPMSVLWERFLAAG